MLKSPEKKLCFFLSDFSVVLVDKDEGAMDGERELDEQIISDEGYRGVGHSGCMDAVVGSVEAVALDTSVLKVSTDSVPEDFVR